MIFLLAIIVKSAKESARCYAWHWKWSGSLIGLVEVVFDRILVHLLIDVLGWIDESSPRSQYRTVNLAVELILVIQYLLSLSVQTYPPVVFT